MNSRSRAGGLAASPGLEACGMSAGATGTAVQPIDMAGVIARSLDLNDDQYARDEISHATWSETYIALLNYATRHGIAEQVFDAAAASLSSHGVD